MGDTKIYEGEYLGLKTVEFECGGYSGAFVQEGANLVRFVYEPDNISILHTTDNLETLRTSRVIGIPILFFPNRIKNGTFSFEGREYHFPINDSENNHIHGLLDGYTKWELAKKEIADGFINIVFKHIIDENSEVYPYFGFNVEITYENVITSNGLFQRISFENQSERNMPFALAYHTTFNVPFTSSPEDKFYVTANLKNKYETDKCIPTGRLLSLDEFGKKAVSDKGCIVNEYALDNLYLSDDSKANVAVIKDTGTNIKIVYEADEKFKHYVLYNSDAKQRFLSIEPQTCCTNAVNSDMETANLITLKPGEEINFYTKIYIKH